ncbi:glucose 1-dehydrogenase [Halobacterium salinarum]|jgi:NAD(P)-dependent dehydrogenase (short-subunit alcohol dehydrogenase family)|uniref:glucose 1-dehydrogenase n=1 Tax=Halobacterium salinarum TaxID=2242 RepID=UPI002554FC2B|nr:glucose 1-dehydrogenase [Halobacterium salinarum]MDL0118487.1 glucose 1-dehydrogenase [Halobacterium salinarum]MDL0120299.1 glucose 1-dehydrogenase [Halobacterium salinarum]MDL0126618.1 glucose 1-dehydrogenase [Halobacterium salinarum]
MAPQLNEHTAVVTGAGSGIGRATAQKLAADGANVVVADVDAEGGRETARQIESADGNAIYVDVDVTKEADVEAMVETALDTYGALDIAHNNAGIEGTNAPLSEQSIEDWHQVLDVNLTGVWLCMKHELPALTSGDGGAIVNTASIAGLAADGAEPYTASKHGVVGLTKAAAVHHAEDGVRVNAVCPGVVRTPMVERAIEEHPDAVDAMTEDQPLGRMAEPEEIAETVAWLASDESSFVNGHALPVEGGKLA